MEESNATDQCYNGRRSVRDAKSLRSGSGIDSATTGRAQQQGKSSSSSRPRYGRSATTSVAQLLSGGCSSLLQKFRRNPCEKPENAYVLLLKISVYEFESIF